MDNLNICWKVRNKTYLPQTAERCILEQGFSTYLTFAEQFQHILKLTGRIYPFYLCYDLCCSKSKNEQVQVGVKLFRHTQVVEHCYIKEHWYAPDSSNKWCKLQQINRTTQFDKFSIALEKVQIVKCILFSDEQTIKKKILLALLQILWYNELYS